MELQKVSLRKIGDYIIRKCNKEDLPHVISINLLSLPEHYSDLFFEEILNELSEAFLVAERDGVIVGYIMCRIEYGLSTLHKFGLARKGHIVSIAVLEQHRRKGLGQGLVEEALQALKNKNCSEVFLEVRISNLEAVRLYEKLGFKVVSRLKWYYRDGEDAYMMGKVL
ncbi:MAG: ribosomal protein S18-alanine N-acetyltransferase [archaeon]|nr:ribosomal protein S18-alanine N-acetyltransferase [archaeon]MCP8316568.1 ribosomal protein S18-alanine N-acetyltransferase [archaeon]MCP8322211.1 ribosomal protein S18-alanine N-acetyltransferase [archaeon]